MSEKDLSYLVEKTEICNYADDTAIYVFGHEPEHIVSSLETDAQTLYCHITAAVERSSAAICALATNLKRTIA